MPYGDNPFGEPRRYQGMFYRFDGAEHISVERSNTDVHVQLSTQHEADYIRQCYEDIFGVTAVVEPLPIEIEDDEYTDSEIRVAQAAMQLGPLCIIIADSDNFSLGWYSPDQVFHDRPDVTAKVFMRQSSPVLDFRHKALLADVAEENVKRYLDTVFPEI